MDYNLDDLKNIKPESSKGVSDVAEDILTPDKEKDNREKNHFHWVKISLIWVFGVLISVISIIVVFHLISPLHWRWLSIEEVTSLEKMFITGIGAALIGKFGNKLVE